MIRFFVRSVVLAALVCLTVLVLSFALSRSSTNLAISIAGADASAEDIAKINHQLGLDRPMPVQFLDWANRAAHGDFGESFLFHEKVSSLIESMLSRHTRARADRDCRGDGGRRPTRHRVRIV